MKVTEERITVVVQRRFDGLHPSDKRYTIEVDGATDYLEMLTADEVRCLIAVLQQALDTSEGKEASHGR